MTLVSRACAGRLRPPVAACWGTAGPGRTPPSLSAKQRQLLLRRSLRRLGGTIAGVALAGAVIALHPAVRRWRSRPGYRHRSSAAIMLRLVL